MLELEHRFRVVDVHTHLDPESTVGPSTRSGTSSPEQLEREMHQAGVVRAVVFPTRQPKNQGYLSANNAVARICVERPFVAVARVSGPRSVTTSATDHLRNLTASQADHHTDPDDIEQYAYDDRFHGFKLHPAQDGLPEAAVLDRLEDVNLPVIVHGGESVPPAALEESLLNRSFPVLLEHFGGYPLRRPLMETAIELLEDHANLYLDTSFVRYREQLERALREHPDRVCFGSGAPAAHPNVGVMEILTLDVPEDAMRKVFDRNPTRLIDALAAES